MEITKVELKILMKEFMTASSRVLRADYAIYDSELKRFINFLENKPLIDNFIKSCGQPDYNVEEEVREVASSYGNLIFSLGDSDEGEVANIFAVTKYLAFNNYGGRSLVYYGYSSSKNCQEKVKCFGDKFLRILISHIENYLAKIGIEMGVDEKTTIQFNIKDSNLENTQFNVATDGSTITSTQSNNPIQEFDKLIKDLQDTLSGICEENQQIVKDCIEVMETIKEEKPKKGIIRMALTTLQGIKGTAEFVAAVTAVAQFVQLYI
ncbi:MAG: hypothetical protein IJE23_06580 [Tyzzerella sp.]|nr:hypothetical protein [Tyzzerella sp.]